MAVTIRGRVKYNRTVQGVYDSGKRKGEHWEFLSLDVLDVATGFSWSCQLPSRDPGYKEIPDDALVGHEVKARITSQTAAKRELPDGSTRMQIRSQITRLEDLGVPDDEE
jgi:hypothetical protein